MTLGALTFASPWLLAGLALLPVIWWLLRLTPPRPREEVFPPTAILEELGQREEVPAQSPWWLTLLRLLMAALVILALSEPVWNAREQTLSQDGPLLIVVDDGWASGRDWESVVATSSALIEEADSAGRPVAMVFSSRAEKAEINPTRASQWAGIISASRPYPITATYTALAQKIRESTVDFSTAVLLSTGLQNEGQSDLKAAIESRGIREVHVFSPGSTAHALTGATNTPSALTVPVERADVDATAAGSVTAYDTKGQSIGSAPFEFGANETTTTARFELPVELRNEVARLSIDDATTAGAVQLLDERFRRRRVGLISGGNADRAQPLLSPLYYISRALQPFSEIRESAADNNVDAIAELINERVATLVLADIGVLPPQAREQIEKWVSDGGMLVRFAGPRLAAAQDNDLVPVALRRGGRSLGGTLTWGEAQPLAAFEENSPFKGIAVPEDVSISRQVLAEPDIDLAEKTWASLKDGTPLVTAAQSGKGWIVLFHVTADASWSNLPLSGAFVDMLRRLVAVSNNAAAADLARTGTQADATNDNRAAETASLAPLQILNGFGDLVAPDAETQPLQLSAGESARVSLENPPGLYGTDDAFVSSNLFNGPAGLARLTPADLPSNTVQNAYTIADPFQIKPYLFAFALVLLALDCLAVLWMAGALQRSMRRAATAAILGGFVILPLVQTPGFGQETSPAIDFENSLRTRLAYVETGIDRLDTISRKGLVGLTQFIASRTSLEPGEPVGVDIATDELAFYPLLYWPVDATSPIPDAATMARIDGFMKRGGSVLFDTRDQLSGGFGGTSVSGATLKLREILASLDIPPLEPVPDKHVLTRAFYLLNVFPGRYLDGQLWVETSQTEDDDPDRPVRAGDGVSSIIITSNDFAGAWAVESDGSPTLPVVPPNPTQRVYAYRTGVNIVMYTLTGNYKSDQVHVPALLERLGQ